MNLTAVVGTEKTCAQPLPRRRGKTRGAAERWFDNANPLLSRIWWAESRLDEVL